MVIGEFGGLESEKADDLTRTGNDPTSRASETLFHDVQDRLPIDMRAELPKYLAEQHESAKEALDLRELLQNSPADFVRNVGPFLDRQIRLGVVAQEGRGQLPQYTNNFNLQAQIGAEAQNMKNTIISQGPDAAAVRTLSDPGIRQGIDVFLQQQDWLQMMGGR